MIISGIYDLYYLTVLTITLSILWQGAYPMVDMGGVDDLCPYTSVHYYCLG